LLDVIRQALVIHEHAVILQPNSCSNWLKQYEENRRRDNLIMMSAMDLLYSLFSNSNMPFTLLRNLGLKLANNAGPIKNNAMKYAMGLA
jgi:2-octaprenyl-3-methyl-6-methoxy-1,4-benzoquinol hydroxylase